MKSLQTVLLVNAVSSGTTSLLLALGASTLAPFFGAVSPAVLREVGLFLLLFAGYVGYVGYQTPTRPGAVQLVIWLDRLWVIASGIVLLLPNTGLTGLGKLIIAAVAAWVALMAYLQATNAKKMTA
ncbi:hypothetical protein ACAW74_04160 [Fibrella sp. WM1]|uniref:hypothetical protein n=1 Tax=Fibrella musci TaxID=3242485 RepID=UPI003520B537